jgi:suppressor for copper-sensitivity B
MGFALSQSSQTILVVFLAVGIGMAFPYLLLAVFPQAIHWLPKPGHWMLSLKKGLALLLLATAAWLGWVLYQQSHHETPSAASTSEGLVWESFDEGVIQGYLRKGRPVFVDVTADWCVTCKYNERFVLGDTEVRAELTRQNVVLMKADWTNHDQTIANYLMKHGRAGIPFYAFYRPGQSPVLLSEFLTKAQILKALQS